MLLAPAPMTSDNIPFLICDERRAHSSPQTWYWARLDGMSDGCAALPELDHKSGINYVKNDLIFVATIPKQRQFEMSPLFNSITGYLDFEFDAYVQHDYRIALRFPVNLIP